MFSEEVNFPSDFKRARQLIAETPFHCDHPETSTLGQKEYNDFLTEMVSDRKSQFVFYDIISLVIALCRILLKKLFTVSMHIPIYCGCDKQLAG